MLVAGKHFKRIIYRSKPDSQLSGEIFNEECHTAKGKQTCSCFEAQLKFVIFFYFVTKIVTTHTI